MKQETLRGTCYQKLPILATGVEPLPEFFVRWSKGVVDFAEFASAASRLGFELVLDPDGQPGAGVYIHEVCREPSVGIPRRMVGILVPEDVLIQQVIERMLGTPDPHDPICDKFTRQLLRHANVEFVDMHVDYVAAFLMERRFRQYPRRITDWLVAV